MLKIKYEKLALLHLRQSIGSVTAKSSLGGMEKDRKCAHFQMQLYAKIFKFTAKNVNNWHTP